MELRAAVMDTATRWNPMHPMVACSPLLITSALKMPVDAGKDQRKQETNLFIFTEEESEGHSKNGVVRPHTELVVNTKSAPRVGIALRLYICHSNCFAPGLWIERVYSLNNRRQAWSVSSPARQSSIGLNINWLMFWGHMLTAQGSGYPGRCL